MMKTTRKDTRAGRFPAGLFLNIRSVTGRLSAAAALVLALAPVSCTRELEPSPSGEGLVAINVVVSSSASLSSEPDATEYEAGSTYENYIDIPGGDYRIYFFNNTGDDVDDTFLAEFVVSDFTPVSDSDYTKYTVYGTIRGSFPSLKKFKVVVLANWGERNYPTGLTSSTTISDICSQGVYNHLTDFVLSESNLIPFYGITAYSDVTFDENGTTTLTAPVNLIRAVAKIEVISDYHFTSVVLHGANLQGYSAPAKVYYNSYSTDNSTYDNSGIPVHLVGEDGTNDTDALYNLIPLVRIGDGTSGESGDDNSGSSGGEGGDDQNGDNSGDDQNGGSGGDDNSGSNSDESIDYSSLSKLWVTGGLNSWSWTGPYLYDFENSGTTYQGVVYFTESYSSLSDGFKISGTSGWDDRCNYGAGSTGTGGPPRGFFYLENGGGSNNITEYNGWAKFFHFTVNTSTLVMTMNYGFNSVSLRIGGVTYEMEYDSSSQSFTVDIPDGSGDAEFYLENGYGNNGSYSYSFTEYLLTSRTLSNSGATRVTIDFNDLDDIRISYYPTTLGSRGDYYYVVGSLNSWTWNGPYLYNFDNYATKNYQGVIDFTVDYATLADGFKLTKQANWDAGSYGHSGGGIGYEGTDYDQIYITQAADPPAIYVYQGVHRYFHFTADMSSYIFYRDLEFDSCILVINGQSYDMEYLLYSQSFRTDIPDGKGTAYFYIDDTLLYTYELEISGPARVAIDFNDLSDDYANIFVTAYPIDSYGGGSGGDGGSDDGTEDDSNRNTGDGSDVGPYYWYCYVPEFDNTSAEGQFAYIQVNPTGYEEDHPGYRIYFKDYSEDPGDYSAKGEFDIHRNVLYRFNVSLVDEYLEVIADQWTNLFEHDYDFHGSGSTN